MLGLLLLRLLLLLLLRLRVRLMRLLLRLLLLLRGMALLVLRRGDDGDRRWRGDCCVRCGRIGRLLWL